MTMTPEQEEIYKESIRVGVQHQTSERDIIKNLQDVHKSQTFIALGKSSLYEYARDVMVLAEPLAYKAMAVARKALQFEELNAAIMQHRLCMSKAARILSSLTPENAEALVAFACAHTIREINFETARINPRSAGRDSDKILSEDWVQITRTISRQAYDDMLRAEDVCGQKSGETFALVYHDFLERRDPVRKAKRNVNKEELCPDRVAAANLHVVRVRDDGQCTYINHLGERCRNRRYIDTHHIVHRSRGGSHHPDNLTTLCRFHHRLIHRKEHSPPSTQARP